MRLTTNDYGSFKSVLSETGAPRAIFYNDFAVPGDIFNVVAYYGPDFAVECVGIAPGTSVAAFLGDFPNAVYITGVINCNPV